jgi:hypothetical protein
MTETDNKRKIKWFIVFLDTEIWYQLILAASSRHTIRNTTSIARLKYDKFLVVPIALYAKDLP